MNRNKTALSVNSLEIMITISMMMFSHFLYRYQMPVFVHNFSKDCIRLPSFLDREVVIVCSKTKTISHNLVKQT